MGEPITLYAPDGDTLTVYGNAQEAAMIEVGYSRTPPAPKPVKEPAAVKEPQPQAAKEPAPVKRGKAKGGL